MLTGMLNHNQTKAKEFTLVMLNIFIHFTPPHFFILVLTCSIRVVSSFENSRDLNEMTLSELSQLMEPEDVATVRSSELLAKLQLEDLNLILRDRRLCWFGPVERSSGAVRTVCDIQIEGRRGKGGPSLHGRN